MFKSGKAYRHDTSQDLDILVVKVRYADKNKAKLLIHWVDKHNGNIRTFPGSRPDGIDNIEVQAKDFQYWKEI